jgi:hypothetical protein
MALAQSSLSSLLEAIAPVTTWTSCANAMTIALQKLIELEATQVIGAAWTIASRTTTARVGDLELQIPGCARASSCPACSSRAGWSTGPCGQA